MTRSVLALLLVVAAVYAAPEGELQLSKKPYQVRNLEFQIGVPEGWAFERDATGVVAQEPVPNGSGYQVTREPFLHDPKEFPQVWSDELAKGGIDAKVKTVRAGKYQAFLASWESPADGGRQISVWRVYVTDNEMLYNVAFSVAKGFDVEALADAVLRSFKCTAPKSNGKLKLGDSPETIAAGYSMRLPDGYVKAEQMATYQAGASRLYVKRLGGFQPPHEAGRIMLNGFHPYTKYGEIRGTDEKGLTDYHWSEFAAKHAKEILKKARSKGGRAGPLKGQALTATFRDKQGVPRRFYSLGAKIKGQVVVLSMIVDLREDRLYRDPFKQFCSSIKER